MDWWCTITQNDAFEAVEKSILHTPVLDLPDTVRLFSVFRDALTLPLDVQYCKIARWSWACCRVWVSPAKSYIDELSSSWQRDTFNEVSSRQTMNLSAWLQALLIDTNHASLSTATKSPHLSQRMDRWLFLFAAYNFEFTYKSGSRNALADALSRRPDY